MSSSTSDSDPASPGRHSTWRAATPWAPLLTLALFVLLEVGLRLQSFGLSGVIRPWNYSGRLFLQTELAVTAEDPAISWRLEANARTFFKGAPFSTNSHGFREREVSLEKPEGVLRIAVLHGDPPRDPTDPSIIARQGELLSRLLAASTT